MTPVKTTPQKKRTGKRNTAAEPPTKKKKVAAEEVTPGPPPPKKARGSSSSSSAAIATGLGEELTKADVEKQGTKVADLTGNPEGALFFISNKPSDATDCLYLTFTKPQMKLSSRAMC